MQYGALRVLLTWLLAGAGGVATEVQLLDANGRAVAPLPAPRDPTTVFVFASTECPITNRYAPELRRLHERFARDGVRFWLVYPDPKEGPEDVRRHAQSFGYGFEALRDPKHDLVRLVGAQVTPEAAVYIGDPEGPRLVYRGRIDDRNVAFGRSRPVPTTRDLEDVLLALERHESPTARSTTAIGCYITALE